MWVQIHHKNAEPDYWYGTSDENWYDENSNELIITTAEELASFAAQVNSGNTFSAKTVKLAANIDLMGREWTPIGGATPLKCTFDGQNHTISNLSINANDSTKTQRLGLFGAANNAVIKNVNVENVSILRT